jgi:hypothetical protein
MKINWFSSSALIFANLYVIYGFFYLGWKLETLFLLFYLDSIFIFLFSLLRTFFVKDSFSKDLYPSIPVSNKIKKTVFVLAVFSFFLYVIYNQFIEVVFPDFSIASVPLIGVLIYLLSHLVSFLYNFLFKKEYLKLDFNLVINRFMYRFAGVYLILLLGGLSLIFTSKNEISFLIIFVLIKIILDFYLHNLQNSN